MGYKSRGRPQSVAKSVADERFWLEPEPVWTERGDRERQSYVKHSPRRNGVITIKRNSILSQRLKEYKSRR